MRLVVRPGPGLAGSFTPPGDKSITHRAVLLGLLSAEPVRITEMNSGADCASTLACARSLGAHVETSGDAWIVRGGDLRESEGVLDCGNSGTTLRLLAGVLAGQPFLSVLSGDASLVRRPVDRVITPLRQMGASLSARAQDRLPPLVIRGGTLHGIRYTLPMPSAQVASCVMLAALFADGETEIVIPGSARDHTERMLRSSGIAIDEERQADGGRTIRLRGPARPRGAPIRIPGDFSAAAFFLAAAAATPGARVCARGVGLNPTRTGLLDVLEAMGARVEREGVTDSAGEPVGDVAVTGPERLKAFDVPAAWIPRLIDEVPAWAIAASAADGTSRLTGAGELRVKESDRLTLLAQNLSRLGVDARVLGDDLEIRGGQIEGGELESGGDHRIAMAFAVLALRARKSVWIDDVSSIATSFPAFADTLRALGGQAELAGRSGPAS